MRRILALAGAFVVGTTLTAQSAGIVYTIPADYEKIKKVVDGLVGKDVNDVSVTQAQNYGANVRSFIEGATGKSVSSTYSPGYFRAYGNNYRQFVRSAAATDPGATTSPTNFQRAGNNYRNLAEGQTGLGITDSRNYLYNYAGRNVKSLAEGQTGLGITDSRHYYFRNAGRNINTTVRKIGITGWRSNYASSVATTNSWTVANNVDQFKKRADQTYYDMYINDNALKKSFKFASGFDPNRLASGLTPITRSNRADSGGIGSVHQTPSYGRTWRGSGKKDIGVHKFCALAKVNLGAYKNYHTSTCRVYRDANGHWILYWNASNKEGHAYCEAVCID